MAAVGDFIQQNERSTTKEQRESVSLENNECFMAGVALVTFLQYSVSMYARMRALNYGFARVCACGAVHSLQPHF